MFGKHVQFFFSERGNTVKIGSYDASGEDKKKSLDTSHQSIPDTWSFIPGTSCDLWQARLASKISPHACVVRSKL